MLLTRFSVFLLLFFSTLSAAKTPITHETMWLMKRVGAPAVSSDGKWAVFTVTEPAYKPGDQVTDLWIVAADGSTKPRRLTARKSVESGAVWHPDNRRVAFAAKAGDVSQIFVLDAVTADEPRQITSLAAGAGAPQWSPDGEWLLLASMVYPGAADEEANQRIAAERKALPYNARVYESFPIRYWDHWLDDRQLHLFVQPAGGGKARDLLAGTNLASRKGFSATQSDTSMEMPAAWAPDSRSVVFAAITNAHQAAYAFITSHLFQVQATGSEPVQLTSGESSYTRPTFRPDGKALYCLQNQRSKHTYTLERLAMMNWPAPGQPRAATAPFDRSVNSFTFSPDSKSIYVSAEDAGLEKVFVAPAAGGESRPLIESSAGAYTKLVSATRAGAPVLLGSWDSAVHPAEVVRLDLNAGKHTALTSFNAERTAEIDWQPLRHFWFTSKRGKRIHSMLALPPDFSESKRYPLLVLIHGGPNSMWRDQYFTRWNYHLLASPGYVVLLTNYTGSTGFGEKFAQEIEGDPFRGPGDEINEAADEAIKRFPFIDRNRQSAGGASYGGHLTNWLQATTTRYKCLISHAGLINLESQWGTSDAIYHREVNAGGPVWEQARVWREQNPIRLAANFRTPILLTVGERDFRVPLNQTLENWSVLQRLKIPSKLIVFPEANHWIMRGVDSRFFYQEVQAWLKQWM